MFLEFSGNYTKKNWQLAIQKQFESAKFQGQTVQHWVQCEVSLHQKPASEIDHVDPSGLSFTMFYWFVENDGGIFSLYEHMKIEPHLAVGPSCVFWISTPVTKPSQLSPTLLMLRGNHHAPVCACVSSGIKQTTIRSNRG